MHKTHTGTIPELQEPGQGTGGTGNGESGPWVWLFCPLATCSGAEHTVPVEQQGQTFSSNPTVGFFETFWGGFRTWSHVPWYLLGLHTVL